MLAVAVDPAQSILHEMQLSFRQLTEIKIKCKAEKFNLGTPRSITYHTRCHRPAVTNLTADTIYYLGAKYP